MHDWSNQPLPLDLFDYDLPEERIAQQPARPRDASRLLLLSRRAEGLEHRRFGELPDLLQPSDLLVVNTTEVVPARLWARKPTGGRVELLLCRPQGAVRSATMWEVMARPGRALRPGGALVLEDDTVVHVRDRCGELTVVETERPLLEVAWDLGEVPLPPYIRRPAGPRAEDREDYQSLFAAEPGAVAAPTASLHFTDRVLAALEARGVRRCPLVLHVGPGTFVPVRNEHAEDVRAHVMHLEWYDIPVETLDAIAVTRARGGRVVAVGTTSVRALESWHQSGEACGEASLFIYPGFVFGVVDAVLTNFHLPRSTLLMLVSAFAGRERILGAYGEAVEQGYRFFSYGDAMLIM
ncbi:tRNA preQ1(34) S-adenosylmethionine ribosyltransferase-isomerase QueA [Myxococcota bacterium]